MWFRARLLYRAVRINGADGGSTTAAPEAGLKETEVFVMVDIPDEAQQAAEDVGRFNEHYDRTSAGQKIRWSFDKVLDLSEVGPEGFPDGAKLYGRLTNKVPPLETLWHVGTCSFFDTLPSEEPAEIDQLRAVFEGDTEYREMARRDFDLALNGTLSDEKVVSIVRDWFNRAVRDRQAAERYLQDLRDTLFGARAD